MCGGSIETRGLYGGKEGVWRMYKGKEDVGGCMGARRLGFYRDKVAVQGIYREKETV